MLETSQLPAASQAYWESRKDSVYLRHIQALVHFIGKDCASLIDVGSNGCPYVDWFNWIEHRASIDLKRPYAGQGVEAITGDFMELDKARQFDIALCLQVLEHIPDAAAFSQRLLDASPRVLISVPYRWPADVDNINGHVQDPVDEYKVASWFGRSPDFWMVSTEVKHPVRRMIAYYERPRWSTIRPD